MLDISVGDKLQVPWCDVNTTERNTHAQILETEYVLHVIPCTSIIQVKPHYLLLWMYSMRNGSIPLFLCDSSKAMCSPRPAR